MREGETMDDNSGLVVIVVLIVCAISFVLIGIPLWRICSRAGLAPAWSLFAIVPYLGPLIVTLILAFSDWPKFKHLQNPGA
jgi:predicted PurR-regulated permease PerM